MNAIEATVQNRRIEIVAPDHLPDGTKVVVEVTPLPRDETVQIQSFHQALLASGFVTTIKPPRVDAVGPRRLIEVKGQPLSETIIEERR